MTQAFTDGLNNGLNNGGGLPDPDRDAQFYTGVPAKRLMAFIIDVVLVWGIAILVSILTLGIGFLIMGFLIAVIDLIYRTLTIGSSSATVGMRLMGMNWFSRTLRRHFPEVGPATKADPCLVNAQALSTAPGT